MSESGNPVTGGTGRALLAALALLVVVIPAVPGHAENAPAFPEAGSFESRGPLYLDEQARLLYHVRGSFPETFIEVRNLDTLEVQGEVSIPWPVSTFAVTSLRGAGLHMRGGLAAVDEENHRLFYPFRDTTTSQLRIGIIDGKNIEVVDDYLMPLPARLDHNTGVEALVYDARSDLLYALLMTPVASDRRQTSGNFFVVAFDATNGAMKWSAPIRRCTSLFTNIGVMSLMGLRGDDLYLGCFVGTADAGVAQILKMRVGDSGITSTKAFASPTLPNRGFFDPASGRVFLLNASLMATFDGDHEAWVGLIVPGNRPQSGVNSATGRVYLCGQEGDGIFFTDGAIATPVPPAVRYPGLNCAPIESSSMQVDEKTGRIFAELRKQNSEGDTVTKWVALQDPVPAYQPPPEFDPDAGAQDIDEVPGLTQSVFNAQGSSYGTRVIWVGGPLGTLDNYSGAYVSGPLRGSVGRDIRFRFGEGGREIRLARVSSAKMTKDGLEAAAIGADRDARLEADMEGIREHPWRRGEFDGDPGTPGHYDDPRPGEPQWPYTPAICLAFGGDTDVPSDEVSGAETNCDLTNHQIEAEANADRYDIAGLMTVGESSAAVETLTDPAKGAVAISTAVSRNIQIADSVFIAEATAKAEAWARGRSGKAGTSYTRTFQGVKILGPGGAVLYSCSTVDECDPADVIGSMNQVLGPRIRARLPEPDTEFLNGTPGGTTARFIQNSWQQVEEQILFDKPVEDLTMAAFELEFRGNLFTQAGLIVKLAGVTSSAGYRIFQLPQPVAFEESADGAIGEAVQASGGSDSQGPQATDEGPKTLIEKIVEKVRTGMEWVFGLGDDFRSLAASWALLLAPLYLLVRRRAMMKHAFGG